jgi:RNA recognition motif-containing protein
VGGLPHDVTQEEFKAFFSAYGEVDDCVIMQDKNTQKSRGFGFITYIDEASSERVIADKAKHIIHGKWIDCKKAVPVHHHSLEKLKQAK